MIEVNWSPFAINPIDYIAGRSRHNLVTSKGEKVVITQSGTDFVVIIGDERIVTGGNANTCYFLNQNGVGIDDN